MITNTPILKHGLAAAGFILAATALSLSASETSFADGYQERHDAMESLGNNMKKLAAAVASDDMDQVAALATEISEIAGRIPVVFEEEVIPEKSRAKPAIWDNFSDFTAKSDAVEAAAMKVAEQAEAGTLPNDPKAVAGMIGSACGGCHKEYRAPEK